MTFRMTVRRIAFAAVVGAVYAVLTMVLAPISYGPVQFRISEILCILPFFFPASVWGLAIGCAIANLLSAYGILDVLFGALATLLAGLVTMQLGRRNGDSLMRKILACLPPVIVNAVVVGALIAYATAESPQVFWPAFLLNGLWVGFGELVVLYALGLPALVLLPKTGLYKSLSILYANTQK
jgi:uncharacterized membrane protein